MTASEFLNGRVCRTKYQLISCTNKKKQSSTPSLPDEIMFYILVWLPADILYHSVRYVCRQWYNIIQDPHFIKEQLSRSVTGLFSHKIEAPHGFQFTEFGKMGPVVTEVSLPFPGILLGTCNGLILFRPKNDVRTVSVVNPLTKQTVTLPRLSCLPYYCFSFSLACVFSKGEHKVLGTYINSGDKSLDCLMLTLGKDHAWKLIRREKLSDACHELWLNRTFSTGEFIYWARDTVSHVVALDVETEIFYEFPSPAVSKILAVQSRWIDVYYSERGKSLSCMVRHHPGLSVDVWVLSDPTSGEWKKIYKIDMDARALISLFDDGMYSLSEECRSLCPIAWVKNGDVLIFVVFGDSGPYVAFDVKTGKPFTFGRRERMSRSMWCGFSYSLVSWTTN